MCYNCGCFIPHDEMGDPKNITESTLISLAKKKRVSLLDLKKNLLQKLSSDETLDPDYEYIFEEASKAWGQSVSDAKKETKKLLARQLHS